MEYFLKSTPIKQIFKMRKVGKIQATWRLKIINEREKPDKK